MVALRTYTAYPVKLVSLGGTKCECHSGICIDGLGTVPLPAVENISRWRPYGPLLPEFEVAPVPEFPHTYQLRSVHDNVLFATQKREQPIEYKRELRYRSVYSNDNSLAKFSSIRR